MSVEHPDDTIQHEDDVESVVDERLDGIDAENAVLADLVAITGGESPTEAEHNAVVTKVNAILARLRNSHIIPSS